MRYLLVEWYWTKQPKKQEGITEHGDFLNNPKKCPHLGSYTWRYKQCMYLHDPEREIEWNWPIILNWLVVDLPLWKIWKSVGMIIPNIWKHKKCSKPPTRLIFAWPIILKIRTLLEIKWHKKLALYVGLSETLRAYPKISWDSRVWGSHRIRRLITNTIFKHALLVANPSISRKQPHKSISKGILRWSHWGIPSTVQPCLSSNIFSACILFC